MKQILKSHAYKQWEPGYEPSCGLWHEVREDRHVKSAEPGFFDDEMRQKTAREADPLTQRRKEPRKGVKQILELQAGKELEPSLG